MNFVGMFAASAYLLYAMWTGVHIDLTLGVFFICITIAFGCCYIADYLEGVNRFIAGHRDEMAWRLDKISAKMDESFSFDENNEEAGHATEKD